MRKDGRHAFLLYVRPQTIKRIKDLARMRRVAAYQAVEDILEHFLAATEAGASMAAAPAWHKR